MPSSPLPWLIIFHLHKFRQGAGEGADALYLSSLTSLICPHIGTMPPSFHHCVQGFQQCSPYFTLSGLPPPHLCMFRLHLNYRYSYYYPGVPVPSPSFSSFPYLLPSLLPYSFSPLVIPLPFSFIYFFTSPFSLTFYFFFFTLRFNHLTTHPQKSQKNPTLGYANRLQLSLN